jgi:hypothetical protein
VIPQRQKVQLPLLLPSPGYYEMGLVCWETWYLLGGAALALMKT